MSSFRPQALPPPAPPAGQRLSTPPPSLPPLASLFPSPQPPLPEFHPQVELGVWCSCQNLNRIYERSIGWLNKEFKFYSNVSRNQQYFVFHTILSQQSFPLFFLVKSKFFTLIILQIPFCLNNKSNKFQTLAPRGRTTFFKIMQEYWFHSIQIEKNESGVQNMGEVYYT